MLGTQKAMIRQAGGRGVGPKVDIINRIKGPLPIQISLITCGPETKNLMSSDVPMVPVPIKYTVLQSYSMKEALTPSNSNSSSNSTR